MCVYIDMLFCKVRLLAPIPNPANHGVNFFSCL